MKTYKQPSSVGRFGEFGGMYVSETLMPLLLNLDKSYKKIQKDKKFKKELNDLFKNYVGRPPLCTLLKFYLNILMDQKYILKEMS